MILFILYTLPIMAFFVMTSIQTKNNRKLVESAKNQIEKMYQQPVNMVIVKNMNEKISVRETDCKLNTSNSIEFAGFLDVDNISNLKTSGDTLMIDGNGIRFELILFTSKNVKVDTLNSPNVEFAPPLQPADTVKHGI